MTDTLVIAAAIFFSVYMLAFVVYLGFRQNLRFKERQWEVENRVRLDEFRAHLEREVMSLNKEFSSNQERFEELNHMIISGQSDITQISKSEPTQSAFLKAHGINIRALSRSPRSIFVLMPFHHDYDGFFSVLNEVGRETNYAVSRGDDLVERSDIFTQVLNGIVSSRFVIANITGRNANVFYELGIAHAIDKEVILVAESEAEIPFDLKSKRIVFYDSHAELHQKLVVAIARLAEV
jgi:hypothetical protein